MQPRHGRVGGVSAAPAVVACATLRDDQIGPRGHLWLLLLGAGNHVLVRRVELELRVLVAVPPYDPFDRLLSPDPTLPPLVAPRLALPRLLVGLATVEIVAHLGVDVWIDSLGSVLVHDDALRRDATPGARSLVRYRTFGRLRRR